MGERQNEPFQLSVNAALKVDFQGSRVTSDGGLILARELDEGVVCGWVSEFSARTPKSMSAALRGSDVPKPDDFGSVRPTCALGSIWVLPSAGPPLLQRSLPVGSASSEVLREFARSATP
jgi:hypothetical protein